MHYYTMSQWLLFFYTYSFLGWCFESTYVSIRSRRLINRGFIRGPFLPLYGSGALMMYIVSFPFQDNVVMTYIAGCIGATALELVTGIAMETLFHVRYWNYSKLPFNYKGYICLGTTLAWGGLTILMTQVIHRPIEHMILSVPVKTAVYISFIITIYIAADFALSFKAALDLGNILAKMQRAKEELWRMQKRLDVIIAVNNNEKEQKRQERELKMDELSEALEQRFNSIKDTIQTAPSSYLNSVRDEIAELRTRYNIYMENRRNAKEMLDFYKRDIIRNNPGMMSEKFKTSFEELKNIVSDKMSGK